MKKMRLAKMDEMILKNKIVTLKQLQEEFNISMNTVRRDVNELVQAGKIRKIHGGVESTATSGKMIDFSQRSITHRSVKEDIGKMASQMVEDNDVIFIDTGTTTVNMASYLMEKENITVITNNIHLIMRMLPMENITVISLGGKVNRKTDSFASKESLIPLDDFNINKAFMAATGFSVKSGASDMLYEENEIKKKVVQKAQEKYLLIDHTKFGVSALLTYCPFEEFDCIITDQASEELKIAGKKYDVKIIDKNK